MAEARAEEDEERLRESGGARRSAEHSDRNKPDQRHSSQGPLSSIRAVIKRTSARTSSQSDHQRDRSRRPEITILSAEPLSSNTWFPGASGAFPPAPPPAPPTWAAGSATVQLPPPSYEQVIREKSREQNLHSSSSSSPSPSSRHSTSTIATQTDTNSPGPQSSAARPVRRHSKPPRPSLPLKHMPEVDWSNTNAGAQPREALREQCGVQTDFDDIIDDISPIGPAPTVTTSTQINLDSAGNPMKEEPSVRPRPRPRSRVALRPNEDVLDQPQKYVIVYQCPSVPKHSRPPPPVLRKTPSTSQATVDVFRAPDASIPSLPPRPSGSKLLPLRPPPIKVAKLPGSSSSPAVTNQLPGSRVPPSLPAPNQDIRFTSAILCVVARFAFEGEEGELSFTEGDVITLMEYVNEEWGRGLLNGQPGIFPLSFIQAIEETEALPRKQALESPAPPAGARIRGRALYDFTPECEDELCLKAGDVVCGLEDMDAEWFLGESGGKRGIIPKNYIQVLLDP
ncbi:SH3 domain-containing protein 19 [Sinocyclocheilus anshuiensis]|uniref:SH3 domain-containing protein 19 n=1 Tax=Sinocyclocheilus anshuiensis TaxID=1608454 RepID=UPI0007B9B4B8|nr:PREDICTED: SH3 domain-containing protein 19-like [Sinocyclocheilus anshuiensis]